MKRHTVHAVFGTVAFACAGLAAFNLFALSRANHANTEFARAVDLAKAGNTEGAIDLYKQQALGTRTEPKLAALYNLGNLYLREASQDATDESTPALPLIELAKQSYRDLLRVEPNDWDARYNLERALALAPEIEDPVIDVEEIPDAEDRTMSTLPGVRIDLP